MFSHMKNSINDSRERYTHTHTHTYFALSKRVPTLLDRTLLKKNIVSNPRNRQIGSDKSGEQ